MSLSPKTGISNGAGVSPSVGVGSEGISATAGVAYAGPFDLVAGGLWGVDSSRALAADMLEQPAYTLVRWDGEPPTEQAFSYNAVLSGVPSIDVAEVETFLGAFDGEPIKLNDHVGNIYIERNPTDHNSWQASAQNGHPGFVCEGTEQFFSVDTLTTANGGATVFLVSTGAVALRMGGGNVIDVSPDPGQALMYISDGVSDAGGEINGAAITPGVHLFTCRLAFGASKAFRIDGVDQEFTVDYGFGPGPIGPNSGIVSVIADVGTTFLTCLIYPVLSAQDEATIEANLQAYWNTPALP